MQSNPLPLTVYNTIAKAKQLFAPQKKEKVSLYTCGPTVYNFAHIGNLRTYVFEDLLKRTLLFFGYKVDHVMNITDVDDKTIKGACAEHKTLQEYTEQYTKSFFEDLESLAILPARAYPRATEFIPQMIEMIEQLLKDQVAYKGEDGSVYFSIRSFPEYGRLSGLQVQQLEEGRSGRMNSDEYDKEAASDFVLWKGYDPERDGDIFWESSFGRGRPGWHIECSAMALSLLGNPIDLHCGGVDNIFPHHENEIAQSECCQKSPFVRYWMHSEHLLVNNQKMSKSAGNFFTLRDLLAKGYTAREVRYLLLQGHYRTQLNFTEEGLKGARAALCRVDDFLYRMQHYQAEEAAQEDAKQIITKCQEGLIKALADDLNISAGFAQLFDLIRSGHTLADEKVLSDAGAHNLITCLQEWDAIFALLMTQEEAIPAHLTKMLEERQKARKEKNWAEADRLRDAIDEAGYFIEDSPEGARLKPKVGS